MWLCQCFTTDQNPERQISELREAGVEERNIYVDRISGRSFDRPSYNLL
ncbi:MAG: recombinase family protein [Eisenbergiella sp.]